MTEEISEYYKEKGYVKVYVVTNKEPRRMAILLREDGSRKVYSYAKYLYTSHYKTEIPEGYEVDHINNNKLDDRVENFQLLLRADNIRKSHRKPVYVERVCPVCGKHFMYRKHDLPGHPNPCCSRHCGGILSVTVAKERGTYVHRQNKIQISYNELLQAHDELKTWDKVADYYGVSLATIKRYKSKAEQGI